MKFGPQRAAFQAVNYFVLIAVGAATLFPILHLFSKSVSDSAAVMAQTVTFYPIGFRLDGYAFVLEETGYLHSLFVSIFVTVVGTVLAVFFSTVVAYPLSKGWLRGRRVLLIVYVAAMVLYPGIVPRYLLMKYLHLLDTVWVLIIPKMLNIYYMFLIKNYLESLPEEIEESARMDGASTFVILIRIILPTAKPILATMTVFYAVEYWNNFFAAMMFITRVDLKPVQLFLLDLIRNSQNPLALQDVSTKYANLLPQTVQAAGVILTVVPIIAVYPFLQRHFVRGIIVGSVKG